jgi:hypothetical protein
VSWLTQGGVAPATDSTERNARGLDALRLYRAEYDDKLRALRPHPVHDWTSHAGDSFHYLAMTHIFARRIGLIREYRDLLLSYSRTAQLSVRGTNNDFAIFVTQLP